MFIANYIDPERLKFAPDFRTLTSYDCDNPRILVLAREASVLERLFQALVHYTATLDPQIPLTERVVTFIATDPKLQMDLADCRGFKNLGTPDSTLSSQNGYFYSMDINQLLPRTVRRAYGFHRPASNCHGSAIVTGGIYPIRTDLLSPLALSALKDQLQEVPLQDVRCGDIVYLDQEDHSFVFLTNEFCLSANGRHTVLEIDSTAYVLAKYNYDPNTFHQKALTKHLTILRRKEYPIYFDAMLPYLKTYFDFDDKALMKFHEDVPEYKELPKVEEELRLFAQKASRDPLLSSSSKVLIQSVYQEVRNHMPAGLIKSPLPDILSIAIPHKKAQKESCPTHLVLSTLSAVVLALLMSQILKIYTQDQS